MMGVDTAVKQGSYELCAEPDDGAMTIATALMTEGCYDKGWSVFDPPLQVWAELWAEANCAGDCCRLRDCQLGNGELLAIHDCN